MNIIKENNNDSLSLMDDIDRNIFFKELEDYYLTYRERLGFSDKVTFGFEIEFEKMKVDIVNRRFEKTLPKGWRVKTDDTLTKGGEIATSILTDNSADWYSVSDVCGRVREVAIVGLNTGSHIHIGAQALGDKPLSWINFMKLWSVYENVIYRFCYGEYVSGRPKISDTAYPMADLFWYYSKKLRNEKNYKKIVRTLNISRYVGVSFRNVYDGKNAKKYNTIEIRCPNDTLNEVLWQNNLNLVIHLVLYANSDEFDEDKIDRRKNINKNIEYNLKYYDRIDIDMALELADMIFDNNLDKLYFLRQYIKSFQIRTSDKLYEKAKPFTKIKICP